MTWQSQAPPPWPDIPRSAWPRITLRLIVLAGLIALGLVVKLVLRVGERPLFGLRRPVTPWITQAVCRAVLLVIGLRLRVEGQPMRARGAMVANHASWLDIFALNAAARVVFVSKAEVAGWPGIGWLARATGTVFIRRDRREAAAQTRIFEARLRAGQRLLFFPEGTSSDSLRVLPFNSTLFAAFFTPGLREVLQVQPVTLAYRTAPGCDPRALGWWGDMPFAGHLLRVLALRRAGEVVVIFHPAHKIAEMPDRKTLAQVCERDVRTGFVTARGDAGVLQKCNTHLE